MYFWMWANLLTCLKGLADPPSPHPPQSLWVGRPAYTLVGFGPNSNTPPYTQTKDHLESLSIFQISRKQMSSRYNGYKPLESVCFTWTETNSHLRADLLFPEPVLPSTQRSMNAHKLLVADIICWDGWVQVLVRPISNSTSLEKACMVFIQTAPPTISRPPYVDSESPTMSQI